MGEEKSKTVSAQQQTAFIEAQANFIDVPLDDLTCDNTLFGVQETEIEHHLDRA